MLCRTLPINFWKQKYFTRHYKENWPKALVTFSRLWPERGWGWGKGGESVKKENLWWKTFPDSAEWNSRKL